MWGEGGGANKIEACAPILESSLDCILIVKRLGSHWLLSNCLLWIGSFSLSRSGMGLKFKSL